LVRFAAPDDGLSDRSGTVNRLYTAMRRKDEAPTEADGLFLAL